MAALIPIGKLALVETNKSDRTGACGRAGLREVKVRRMLDTTVNAIGATTNLSTAWRPCLAASTGAARSPSTRWAWSRRTTCTMNLGGTRPRAHRSASPVHVSRCRVLRSTGSAAASPALAEQVFRWHDDLLYVLPKDIHGRRPHQRRAADAGHRLGLGARERSELLLVPHRFAVAVAAAGLRRLGGGLLQADLYADRRRSPTASRPWTSRFLGGVGYGGGTVQLTSPDPTMTHPVNKLKDNQWVMLCGWTPDTAAIGSRSAASGIGWWA